LHEILLIPLFFDDLAIFRLNALEDAKGQNTAIRDGQPRERMQISPWVPSSTRLKLQLFFIRQQDKYCGGFIK
jgi:hypothetical protein